MSNKVIQILLIEDNPGDARLIKEMLSEIQDAAYNVQIADRLSAGLDCLTSTQVDIVLLDLGLPDSQGLETLKKLRAKARGLPVVVLTDLEDESIAVEAVRQGAQDYLTKRRVHTEVLWRVIRYAFERQQLGRALEASAEQYRTLVENANEAIFVAQDGKLKFVNPKATEMTGYSKEELLSINFSDLIHHDDRDMVIERHSKRLRGEKLPHVYPFKIINKGGQTKWVEINSVLISWNDRPATLNFLTDITDREKAEQQVLLASKLASIGELAAGVAHEINNPLTGIIGYANLLISEPDVPPNIKDDLRKIYDESQRAAKIVHNLLSFARRHKPQKDYLYINELIERTLELQSYALKTSNVAVYIKLDPDLPQIKADYNQMQQAILNIINNAMQAIADTKRKGRITITTNREKDNITISIADNGCGIPVENVERVFDPFFTTKGVGKGSGLGLSMCHGTITEHGGNIRIESTLGKGTTFTIELPTTTEGPYVIEETAEEAESNGSTQSAIKILIVDDEPSIGEILIRALSAQGYQSDAVTDGNAALAMLENDWHDLYLIDVKMPVMSGRELYNIMKKRYPEQAKKAIFITGDTVSNHTKSFLDSTGRPYISKPFDFSTLTKVFEGVLQEKRQQTNRPKR